jgi:acyl-CoA thioester hydrolase
MTRDDAWSAEITLKVPFHDIDMMGVVWHGHYAKYFEYARTALLERIDFGYEAMKTSGYAWPVIDMHVRYAQPIQYGQRICVKARLTEYETRLRVDYVIRDADTGRRLTRGHTMQVALDMAEGEMCLVSPDIVFDKLGVDKP